MSWKRYYLKASVFRNELWSLKRGQDKLFESTTSTFVPLSTHLIESL